MGDAPTIPFESRGAWAAWLAEHGADSPDGLWLKLAKKGNPVGSVSYAEALEEALRVGWIDGQKRPVDEAWWLQRFTPRRPRSKWSRRNVTAAEALIAEGRMEPAGQAEVDRAKADGRWAAAYEAQSEMTVPPDLRAALDADPPAAAAFAALNRANRYAILFRVHDAKRPETRARRIAKFVAMCRAGETLH